MPAQSTLATLRASLEEERDQLRRQLAGLGAGGGGLDFDENFADSGQVAAEQGESRVLAASLEEQLRDVERALDKMEEGSYGKCEVCGDAIAEPRLEAMPATRFCIKHA